MPLIDNGKSPVWPDGRTDEADRRSPRDGRRTDMTHSSSASVPQSVARMTVVRVGR